MDRHKQYIATMLEVAAAKARDAAKEHEKAVGRPARQHWLQQQLYWEGRVDYWRGRQEGG